MHTFFLEPDQWREPFVLTGAEAHHLAKVLRLRSGERVRCMDGQGREGVFEVADPGKTRTALALVEERSHPRPASSAWIALGWTKGLRRGWLLEKAVELEAGGIWLWRAERSQGRIPQETKDSWHGQIKAGAKQCANPWLPELRLFPGGLGELMDAGSSFDQKAVLWENPDGATLLGPDQAARPGRSLFVLGPEGGLTRNEVEQLARGGYAPVSLGRRILRWETAALLCLGLCWWARQQS